MADVAVNSRTVTDDDVVITSESRLFTTIILTVPGNAVPKTFFCAVVIGIKVKSSLSKGPCEPFDFKTPIILKGTPWILICLSTGLTSPNNSIETVEPMIATLEEFLISSGIKFLPNKSS